mmetsp:Transcript_13480/g.17030  ORF Transcript_13480/g.17030 Transcript_13480/m.17030 type:complete len:222 (+) Transcript_13480:116-781(+)
MLHATSRFALCWAIFLFACLSSIDADVFVEDENSETGLRLGFANPSSSPSPSISFSPTSSEKPSSSPSTPKEAPSESPSTAPSAKQERPTPKPTRKYTTNPTSSPTTSAMPTAPIPSRRGFGHYFLLVLKWIFFLFICAVLAVLCFEHWDRIYYFLMQCMRQLRIYCEAGMYKLRESCGLCLSKGKELIMRLIVRMNNTRGGGGAGGDDGSMLDGLLMGSR